MKPSELPDIGNQACACDTETSGLFVDDGARVAVVSIAWLDDQDQVISYAFPFDQGPRDKLAQTSLDLFDMENVNLPETEWYSLLGWLQQRRLVFHNAKFDCHMLKAGTRHWPGVSLIDNAVWDTSLGNREIWPTHPTALKTTAAQIGLIGDGSERDDEKALKDALKAQQKNRRVASGKNRYDLLPWETIEPYAAKDAILTILLYMRHLDELEQGTVSRAHIDRELEVCKMLYRMEQRGIGFDSVRCLQAAAQLKEAKVEIARALPYPATVAGAKKYYFDPANKEGMDLIPYETTDNGAPALNDTVIRKMLNDQVPFIDIYQKCRKIDVALSMWYEAYPAMIGNDGRLRTNYRQTKESGEGGGGAVSGRFSVERVNLQAIPHQSKLDLPEGVATPREFFGPREGCDLYELDLRQAELRVAAKVAKCGPMLEMIEAEADLHAVTATELFDVTPESDDWFKYRQIAKRGNFSFIFGVGPETFRQTLFKEAGIVLSLSDADGIVQAWRSLYPQFGRAIHRYDRAADRDRYVKLVNGRKRWFYPYEYTHKAFNQVVQGSLAEFAKQWALATEHHHPGWLLLLIHDSQVMEVPAGDEGLRIVEHVARIGTKLGTNWFKVPMGVDFGKWGEH